MNWIKRPLKLEVVSWGRYTTRYLTDHDPHIDLRKNIVYEDFKTTKAYLQFLEDNRNNLQKLLIKNSLKAVGIKRCAVGYNNDDFIMDMFSVYIKYYAVRVPRFAKNYLLNKTICKQFANYATKKSGVP